MCVVSDLGEAVLNIKETITRSSAIECLAVYGRFLAERLLSLRSCIEKEEERFSSDVAFRLLLTRLAGLIENSPDGVPLADPNELRSAPPPTLKLAFINSGGSSRADLTVSEVEKLRPAYFSCYLTHLLVYHSGIPLLALLVRISFHEVIFLILTCI